VAVADPDGMHGFLYRRSELIVRTSQVRRVRAVAGRRVAAAEELDVAGFSRLRLTDGTDALTVAEQVSKRHGEPLATLNHVFRGEAAYPGGVPGPPVAVPFVPPPVPRRGGRPTPRVAVLDTGWVLHRWLWRSPSNLDLDPDHAEEEPELAALGDGGLAGHGTFAAGLVLRACPDARILFRRVLDRAGVCDEVQLATALDRLGRDPDSAPDLVLVPAGGYTWGDRLSPILAQALEGAPPMVAAAGNAGLDGRPFWPAAADGVLAVAALSPGGRVAPFSNRGPWIDAATVGAGVESAFPDLPRGRIGAGYVADGYARWSGTSFAAALLAGTVAARMAASAEPAAKAVRSLVDGGVPAPDVGAGAVRVVSPVDRGPATSDGGSRAGAPAPSRPVPPGPLLSQPPPEDETEPPPGPPPAMPPPVTGPSTGEPWTSPGPTSPPPQTSPPPVTGPVTGEVPPVGGHPPPYGAEPRSASPAPDPRQLWRRLTARLRSAPEHQISTGFAAVTDPYRPLGRRRALDPGAPYLYWFEIGAERVAGAIDRGPGGQLPLVQPPAGTPLTVALFDFDGELAIDPNAAVGHLEIQAGGGVRVRQQPRPGAAPGGSRLFFPVRTPDRPGTYRLRANLYCHRTLLQSRLVEVRVGGGRWSTHAPLASTVDYSVAGRLDPAALATVAPLRLSAFLNDNGDGTHSFRFFGERGLRGDAVLDAGLLQDAVQRAREAYRKAAWGTAEDWRESDAYAYAGRPTRERFSADLIRLARAGYRLWTTVAGPLAEAAAPAPADGWSPVASLRELMRAPGTVEISTKHSARMVVPAAILYDYPLNTQLDLTVCPEALGAIEAGANLAEHRCFRGDCPHYAEDAVVCPGGFWGFRHAVGLPQSTDSKHQLDLVQEIRCPTRPDFVIGATTDPTFGTLEAHLGRVRAMGSAGSLLSHDSLALVEALRARPFGGHVIYFFCHGVLADGIPALVVGPPGSPGITPELIADGRVFWPATRPLVVLNGCGTAALEPRYALNMVDAFVRRAGASGVVGTEITVFESLAVAFADELFGGFLQRGAPLGEAVRRARLALLAAGNPLGLVYIAYAAPQLRLAR
jgi:hypothetical protein